MSDLIWLTDAQMARLEPYFPKSHGKPRVDDRRVLSGIIFINRNGLRWRDAPKEYGPHKTLYNRWKRWSDKGIFAQMMVGLAAEHGEQKTVMIDATYLKAHRTASSLGVKKGGVLLEELPPIQRLLNRVLALPIHMQNTLFAEFMQRIGESSNLGSEPRLGFVIRNRRGRKGLSKI